MAKYRVDVTYDMGMSYGGETHEFEAHDDDEAGRYLKELEGSSLSFIKRNVRVQEGTLSRVLGR